MKNKILLLIVAAQAKAFGTSLRAMDSDDKGNDDIIGHILESAGGALTAYAASDDKGFRKYLKVIADSINEFLSPSNQ